MTPAASTAAADRVEAAVQLLPLLSLPGGAAPLHLDEQAVSGPGGQRYPFEQGILRMLEQIDPLLARELEAQAKAIPEYLDPQLLMPHYERDFVARLAIDELLPKTMGRDGTVTALDVGCGVGLLGRLYPQMRWIGLDASIDLLRQVTTGYRLLIEGTAEQLPFRSATFDLVVAMNMLHHVINPEHAMAEFARVLKPGGTLIAVDPRKVWLVEIGKRLLRSNDPAFAETHKAFCVDEYRKLLEARGAFEIERFEHVGLVGLIGMGGFDATRISRLLPSPERSVRAFVRLDEALCRLPLLRKGGLNLAARAIRSAR